MSFRNIFGNCLEVRETEYGLLPVRFTQQQLDFYKINNHDREIRSFCTAGVTMRFSTDSEEISFYYYISDCARYNQTFDFYENGVLCGSVLLKEREREKITYKKRTPGKVSFVIYMPCCSVVHISEFSAGDYTPEPECGLKKYLAIGDSITQGMETESTSQIYSVLLSQHYGVEGLNHGVGGACYHPSVLDETMPFTPDIITVAYGANDPAQRDFDKVEGNIKSFFDKLAVIYPKAKVYVLTPIWTLQLDTDPVYTEKFMQVCEWIRKYAGERNYSVIEGLELVPHLSAYLKDGQIHPNQIGFLNYALNIIKAVREDKSK